MGDLVTARLLIHPLNAAEAERVLTGIPDDAARWAPGYPAEGDASAARRFLRTCASTGDPQPFGTYVIRRREDGRAIGGVDFHGRPDENGSVTIGYGLISSAHGKGYASEALRALLTFARAQGVSSVHGDTGRENFASQHVMTAVGMRLVAEDDRLRYYRKTWDDATETAGSHS
ncbi:GNAT family N-acetyltransferase [Streptomyces sp. NPDC048248]|uniref:GNAT family N-acetyltransferase n=1 Tax=Streptomyces sp. NPDC048248 TaxID=3365523 RepID=UPI00371CF733